MSIATDENVRQLLKRMAALEERVKQLEDAAQELNAKKSSAKGLIQRAKDAASRMEI